jgi:hypothetical protein
MRFGVFSFLKSRNRVLLSLIVIVYILNGIYYLRNQSITSDEGSFIDYAIRYLRGNPGRMYPRVDNSKLPVTVLNLAPRIVTQVVQPALEKKDWGFSDTMNGRYVTLLVSIFTILLVYLWGKNLYGANAGLFSAFLMSLCPNNIANAALVTTDAYSVLFLLLSMYLLWKYCNSKSAKYFMLFAVVVALSQLVKQSLFHLYIIAPICLLVFRLINRQKFFPGLFSRLFLVFIAINLLIINAGYYFHQSFMNLGSYSFMSSLFQGLQQALPGWLPLPFPRPFVDGLDMAKYYDQLGGGYDKISSFGKVTIAGKSATGQGFWYYYFVSIFYKTPIPYFIFFVLAAALLKKIRTARQFFNNEFFLLIPVIYFLVLLSFFYKTQCGIRHIIFIYPFIFIMCGNVINFLNNRVKQFAFAIVCLWLLATVVRYAGNYFPYTNEFIWDKKMAFTKVGSSNLDFLHGYFFAKKYIEKNPDVKWAPEKPETGKFIISVPNYLDNWNRHKYNWTSKYPPVDHVAYTFLIIEVKKIE